MTDIQERRRYPRVKLNMMVQFRVDSYEQFLKEYALDISTGGMFIRTDSPRPEGSILFFQFAVSGAEDIITGQAKVVHVNQPGGSSPVGMGLEFIYLDKHSQEVVADIVTSRLSNGQLC